MFPHVGPSLCGVPLEPKHSISEYNAKYVVTVIGRQRDVYDIANNTGWVSVGVDHDTAAFAAETIRRWWYGMGKYFYPSATELLITADSGGSNGSRVRYHH